MSEGPNKRGELKFGLAKHFSKSRQIYLIIIFELIHYLGSSTKSTSSCRCLYEKLKIE